jgi:microcystin-dependent protein
MSQPYVGEIRLFAGNFAPVGWAFCSGQTIPISENDILFNLIGTTYGGDGQSTFQLPNLQSRFPLHMGTGSDGITYQIGEMAGVEQVTVTTQQLPTHNHVPNASNSGGSDSPTGNVWGTTATGKCYIAPGSPAAPQTMNVATIGISGGSQPHENMMPFLCINYIISLFGVFPNQN